MLTIRWGGRHGGPNESPISELRAGPRWTEAEFLTLLRELTDHLTPDAVPPLIATADIRGLQRVTLKMADSGERWSDVDLSGDTVDKVALRKALAVFNQDQRPRPK